MSSFNEVLGALSRPPQGRCRRISSNEQPNWNDSNFDMTPLPPGEVLELPLIKGPGYINHIWFTSHAGGVNELNALSIRIYWDGRDVPGVEAPLGEFFAVGQGKPADVDSFPVQVSPTGSLSCYWKMPFRESARIVITNDNMDRTSGLYWQVDYVEVPELPEDTAYFHAWYRQEYPAKLGSDYLLADIKGSGNYVGTVMSFTMAQDGWFGEGDDFFYIDGEEVPSLQGTGSEDYFNDAWGFRRRNSTWFGQPRWTGWSAGDHGICYRWHILDPIGFTESLKVTIEHKGNEADSVDGWFFERPDYINSVAFWYQTGPPSGRADLPPWPQRCVPWHNYQLVRYYLKAKMHPTGTAQALSVQTTGFFGGRPALQWQPAEAEDVLELPFAAVQSGRQAVRLVLLKSPSSGAFDILLDGITVLENCQLKSEEEDEVDLLLGTFDLTAGEHALGFRARRCHGNPGCLAAEMIKTLNLPEPGGRKIKNHNEAHFVRLGIGRAVYAYRLAYGYLPASLEQLVDSGIMDARYLQDENGRPLTCHLDSDKFFVSSPEPGGWTHHWFGTDARR